MLSCKHEYKHHVFVDKSSARLFDFALITSLDFLTSCCIVGIKSIFGTAKLNFIFKIHNLNVKKVFRLPFLPLFHPFSVVKNGIEAPNLTKKPN